MKSKSRKFGPRLTVSLTGEDYELLNVLAEKDEVSVSWVVRRAISHYLDKHNRQLNDPSDIDQVSKHHPSKRKAS